MQKNAAKKVPSISFPEGGEASDSIELKAVLQIVCVFYFPIKSHLLPSLFTPAGDLMCQPLLIYITPMFGLKLVSLACLHVIKLIVLHMFTLSDLLQPDGAYM